MQEYIPDNPDNNSNTGDKIWFFLTEDFKYRSNKDTKKR